MLKKGFDSVFRRVLGSPVPTSFEILADSWGWVFSKEMFPSQPPPPKKKTRMASENGTTFRPKKTAAKAEAKTTRHPQNSEALAFAYATVDDAMDEKRHTFPGETTGLRLGRMWKVMRFWIIGPGTSLRSNPSIDMWSLLLIFFLLENFR